MAKYVVVRKGNDPFPPTLIETMKEEYGVTVLSQDRNVLVVETTPANAEWLRWDYPVELVVEPNLTHEHTQS